MKKLFSIKYNKPGPRIDLDLNLAKTIYMQEKGTLELFGVQRGYTVCLVIDKTMTEVTVEEAKKHPVAHPQ